MASTTLEVGVQCIDCNTEGSDKKILLNCSQHYICTMNCLPARVLANQSPRDCNICSRNPPDPSKVDSADTNIATEQTSNNYSAEQSATKTNTVISYRDALLSGKEITRNESYSTIASTTKEPSNKSLPDLPGIYIFVDDSNIWIEAKKLQSKVKKFKTGEDHRIRIDLGQLADVIAGSRKMEEGTLYGSEPPPVDTIWEKIREKGWKVKTDKRHALTGKEKKVDTRLVAESTALAIRTSVEKRTTIVLVTGDADAIPAIEEIMREDRWMVEVYMWKQAVSRELKEYARKSQRVLIKHLDHFLDRVSFTHMRFDISDKRLRPLVNAYGVVFTMEHKVFSNHIPTRTWLDQVESIAQWPFQYYWFKKHKGKQTNNLVVVFRPDKVAEEFDVAQFLENIQVDDEECEQKYRLPHTLQVRSFRQFISDEFKVKNPEMEVIDAALEKVGIYNDNDVQEGYENKTVYESDPSDKFTTYLRKPRSHQFSKQKYSDSCPLKFNCKDGTGCQYKHSDEEKAYFKKRKQGKGNPVRKVKPCRGKCTKAKNECDFAHGSEDAWCLNCRCSGHFTCECKEESTSK